MGHAYYLNPIYLFLLMLWAGCHWHAMPEPATVASGPPVALGPLENPLVIPAADRDFVWDQLVDTLDDYFPIEREQRVQQIGDTLVRGRITTHYKTGSTVLEPWQLDSSTPYEKWHSTFQSIRRRATVEVTPVPAGYQVAVEVQKELEDVDRPENSPVGVGTPQFSGTLLRIEPPPPPNAGRLGWIPLGRDVELEQAILADIQSRIAG